MSENKPIDLEAIERTDKRLKEFGFIDGWYMWGKCKKCAGPLDYVQKHCWHCFDCASQMLRDKLDGKPLKPKETIMSELIDLEAMDTLIAEVTHNGGQSSQEFDNWSDRHRNNWAAIKAEVESLRQRVRELDAWVAESQILGGLFVSGFKCSDHGLISPIPICPKCETPTPTEGAKA